jgi:actin-like ATPase involved in cell morphogenesis
VIADFEITEHMLRYFIRKIHPGKTLLRRRPISGFPARAAALNVVGKHAADRRRLRQGAQLVVQRRGVRVAERGNSEGASLLQRVGTVEALEQELPVTFYLVS